LSNFLRAPRVKLTDDEESDFNLIKHPESIKDKNQNISLSDEEDEWRFPENTIRDISNK